jgi:hypothetical protein
VATLQEIIDQIQDVTGALSGVRSAPDEPPELVSAWPAVIAYSASGQWRGGDPPQIMNGTHTIVIQMHVPRKDLARDVATLMGYAKSLPNALFKAWLVDGTLTAMNYIREINYRLRTDQTIGETPTVCIEWTVAGVNTRDIIA